MGKYRQVPAKIQNTLEEGTENIKKAAKEAGSIAAKTVEEVKDKVEEITESTEKKVKAVKKTVKSTASKKSEPKKEKAAFSKSLKEKLTFQFNGKETSSEDIVRRVEKDVVSKCGKVTVKKLEMYFNANENVVYYVVNDEARPEYKIEL